MNKPEHAETCPFTVATARGVRPGELVPCDCGALRVAITLPERPWHCTRGHTWEAPYKVTGISFAFGEEFGMMQGDFCLRCCFEWCREHLGQVREGRR